MNRDGYTLIEILVTLTIVGLLFSFGFANFRGFSRKQHLLAVAKDIVGSLRLAQEKAISGQKPDDAKCASPNYLITYDFSFSSPSTYRLVAVCTGGSVIVKNQDLSSDIVMTLSQNPISFKILGQGTNVPSGSDAEISLSLSDDSQNTKIYVSSTGSIK